MSAHVIRKNLGRRCLLAVQLHLVRGKRWVEKAVWLVLPGSKNQLVYPDNLASDPSRLQKNLDLKRELIAYLQY